MFVLLAAFIVVPLVEIYVLVQVGGAIGALNTIAILLLVSLAGAWLAKYAGFGVLARMRAQIAAGHTPTNELIDGVLVFAGAVLMVVPGFVTDAFGLLLIFPPTRSVARTIVKRRLRIVTIDGRRLDRPGGPGDDIIDL